MENNNFTNNSIPGQPTTNVGQPQQVVTPIPTPVVTPQPIVEPQPTIIPQPKPQPVVKPANKHIFTNIDLSKDDPTSNTFNIKVIGIGGAGCNVINHIAANHKAITEAATIYAFNTDLCSLKLMKNVENLYLLNKDELKGYGSGCSPELGKKAVQKDEEVIKKELAGTDILFIIAGMGKGAGSGGAPELARIAKDLGILTVAIVNMPSVACEGNVIYNNAFNSLQSLVVYADTVSTISNEKIISNNKDISFYDAYQLANQEISYIIEDIIDIIFKPSMMNIDFADLKSFFKENKFFLSNRLTIDATNFAQIKIREAIATKIKQSFSDVNINNCKEVLANITISKDAPTTFIADVNKSFAEITKNDKLSMVAGVNYNEDKKVEIAFLISGKSHSSTFDDAIENDDTSPITDWAEPTVKIETTSDSDANEYDKLMKDVEAASRDTQDIINEQTKKVEPKGEDDIG